MCVILGQAWAVTRFPRKSRSGIMHLRIRVPPLPTGPLVPGSDPVCDHSFIDPEPYVTALNQTTIVLGPVRDTVLCLRELVPMRLIQFVGHGLDDQRWREAHSYHPKAISAPTPCLNLCLARAPVVSRRPRPAGPGPAPPRSWNELGRPARPHLTGPPGLRRSGSPERRPGSRGRAWSGTRRAHRRRCRPRSHRGGRGQPGWLAGDLAVRLLSGQCPHGSPPKNGSIATKVREVPQADVVKLVRKTCISGKTRGGFENEVSEWIFASENNDLGTWEREHSNPSFWEHSRYSNASADVLQSHLPKCSTMRMDDFRGMRSGKNHILSI